MLVAPPAQDVLDEVGGEQAGRMSGQMLVPYWMKHILKVRRTQPCRFCLYKQQTNVICGRSLGILAMDLASVHCFAFCTSRT